MFALPKMRKYNFKVVLDDNGAPTSTWPKEAGKATLLVLKNLEIISTQHESTSEAIKKFISDQQVTLSAPTMAEPVVAPAKKLKKKK
jgi:hypothetical protein